MIAIAKVRADAGAEFFGFTDIQDAIGRIAHKINTRFGGDFFESLFDVRSHRRRNIELRAIELFF